MKSYKILGCFLILILLVFVIRTTACEESKKSVARPQLVVKANKLEKPKIEEQKIEKPEKVIKEEPIIQPENYGFLPLDNNVFGVSILSGYFLNSVTNASIAAKLLNDTVINPGETFSFNQAVGIRTTDRGFVNGTVIIGDQYVPGVGGGVCRASTALYNIAQAAQLPILQRTGHTMPIAYASRGRDAAVWWPDMDLRFTNNKEFPIKIKTLEQDGKLYFGLALVEAIEQEVAEPIEAEESVEAGELAELPEQTEKPAEISEQGSELE